MRLKEKEVQAIINSFSQVLPDLKGELYLFGSRVDDNKKGGDIDLLLVTDENYLAQYLEKKTAVNSKIQSLIGEQRVDLTFVSSKQLYEDEFLKSLNDKVLIKQF